MFEIPAAFHLDAKGYTGVIFHPDLLCDTPLERHIDDYPTRCSCHGTLTERGGEPFPIVWGKSTRSCTMPSTGTAGSIIVSHIELLLNYCTQFCDHNGYKK